MEDVTPTTNRGSNPTDYHGEPIVPGGIKKSEQTIQTPLFITETERRVLIFALEEYYGSFSLPNIQQMVVEALIVKLEAHNR